MSIKTMIWLAVAVLAAFLLVAVIMFPDAECDVFVEMDGTVSFGACYQPER